ncbi:MAG: hypothetical protein NTU83_09050 [Candidatus Hydrogenedentes bacterium]|nr:hypothetical protein [Candidatus Hydrogenedentota bacterium]
MSSKAFIQTYGCQMNEHDSFRMMEILSTLGYERTREIGEASLVLVNTCSVRHNPENKVYSFLGMLEKQKQRNPALIVGVAGCVAQQSGAAILRRARVVDMVFGPDQMFRLPEMLQAVQHGEGASTTSSPASGSNAVISTAASPSSRSAKGAATAVRFASCRRRAGARSRANRTTSSKRRAH